MDRWISTRFVENKGGSILKLKLPGTHHSAMNYMTLNTTKKSFLFLKIFPMTKPCLKSITLTQEMDVYEQLMSGIRFFDIRVAYYKNDFYVAHTFIGKKLSVVFDDFLKFISEHPSEPFIIKFRKDNMNKDSFPKNVDQDNLGLDLHKIKNFISSTADLNFMISEKKPIIILSDFRVPSTSTYIRTTDTKIKIDFIMEKLSSSYLLDFPLTLTDGDAVAAVLSGILGPFVILISFILIIMKININKSENKKTKTFYILVAINIIFSLTIIVSLSINSRRNLKYFAKIINEKIINIPVEKWGDRPFSFINDYPTPELIKYIIDLND